MQNDISMIQTQTANPSNPDNDIAEPRFTLTPELKKTYLENGYIILKDVLPKDKLTELAGTILGEFEKAKQSGSLFAGGGTISGHINCYPGEGSRYFYEELVRQGIIDIVQKLTPKAVRLPNVGCNLNLPHSVPQHYHTDFPYTREFLIVNIGVVDTDITNGAIDVLPGTHQKFYKFWQYALERLYRKTTRLPLKRGDVLIRTSNLWHRGMPNFSNTPRPMMAFTWEDGGSKLADPFGVDGGKVKFRENWYRRNFLGRLRERTFVAAPITYSAYRFVRSLYGNKGY